MSDEEPLAVRREGPVVRAVLNRPHRRNAMSASMMLSHSCSTMMHVTAMASHSALARSTSKPCSSLFAST